VTGSPNLRCNWARNAAGRTIHAIVCQTAGARGPGGSSMQAMLRTAARLGLSFDHLAGSTPSARHRRTVERSAK
jgi:hypothetical protein